MKNERRSPFRWSSLSRIGATNYLASSRLRGTWFGAAAERCTCLERTGWAVTLPRGPLQEPARRSSSCFWA